MSPLLMLPVLIPLGCRGPGPGHAGAPAQRSGSSPSRPRCCCSSPAIALLVPSDRDGIQTLQLGDWPAPFGITMVADLFSAILVVLAGVLAVAITIYSSASIDRRRESFGYYPLTMVLLAGVCGTFLTGDLFNLYVWFEVLLDRLLRAPGARRRASPARGSPQVRRAQPHRLGHLAGHHRRALRAHRDRQPG